MAGKCDFRFHDGKIAEVWISPDELRLIELGIVEREELIQATKDLNIATRDRGLKLKLGTIDGIRIVALGVRGRIGFVASPPIPLGVDQVNESACQRQHRPSNS